MHYVMKHCTVPPIGAAIFVQSMSSFYGFLHICRGDDRFLGDIVPLVQRTSCIFDIICKTLFDILHKIIITMDLLYYPWKAKNAQVLKRPSKSFGLFLC